MPSNITHSSSEMALDYKTWILLDPKIEEFPTLVHKLIVTLTTLQYQLQWKIGLEIYKPRVIMLCIWCDGVPTIQ